MFRYVCTQTDSMKWGIAPALQRGTPTQMHHFCSQSMNRTRTHYQSHVLTGGHSAFTCAAPSSSMCVSFSLDRASAGFEIEGTRKIQSPMQNRSARFSRRQQYEKGTKTWYTLLRLPPLQPHCQYKRYPVARQRPSPCLQSYQGACCLTLIDPLLAGRVHIVAADNRHWRSKELQAVRCLQRLCPQILFPRRHVLSPARLCRSLHMGRILDGCTANWTHLPYRSSVARGGTNGDGQSQQNARDHVHDHIAAKARSEHCAAKRVSANSSPVLQSWLPHLLGDMMTLPPPPPQPVRDTWPAWRHRAPGRQLHCERVSTPAADLAASPMRSQTLQGYQGPAASALAHSTASHTSRAASQLCHVPGRRGARTPPRRFCHPGGGRLVYTTSCARRGRAEAVHEQTEAGPSEDQRASHSGTRP